MRTVTDANDKHIHRHVEQRIPVRKRDRKDTSDNTLLTYLFISVCVLFTPREGEKRTRVMGINSPHRCESHGVSKSCQGVTIDFLGLLQTALFLLSTFLQISYCCCCSCISCSTAFEDTGCPTFDVPHKWREN